MLGLRMTVMAHAIRDAGFNPVSLFALGEQGALYYPDASFAGLYQDAAGTTPVTTVEQPVGLMLDRRFGLARGAELVPNGGFSDATGWSVGTGWTIAGGVATHASAGGAGALGYAGVIASGKTYEVLFTRLDAGVGSINVVAGGTTYGVAAGTGRLRVVTVAGATNTSISFQGGGDYIIDDVSVREIPGNHATQATAAARPVLSARKNLLLGTEDFTSSGWIKTECAVQAAAESGYFEITETATAANHYVSRSTFTGVSGQVYTEQFVVQAGTRSAVSLRLSNASGGARAFYNLATGVVTSSSVYGTGWTVVNASIAPLDGGKFLCVISASSTDALGVSSNLFAVQSGVNDNYAGVAGQVAVKFGKPQIEIGPTTTRYQRVNTTTDYDTAGFPYYLKFDGVDDFLVTGNVNFTATDKVSAWAGVAKYQDAATAALVELSVDSNVNAGTFAMFAPVVTTSVNARFRSRSGAVVDADQPYPGATPVVITGAGDIAGDMVRVAVNRAANTIATDQGAGNYTNAPLYIGKRGGVSAPFSGALYGLAIRGAASTAAQTDAAARFMANLSGVTL